jgi:hypothetical protein
MERICHNCEIKFEGGKDTKTCSQYCKEELKRKKKQQHWVDVGPKKSLKTYKNPFKDGLILEY